MSTRGARARETTLAIPTWTRHPARRLPALFRQGHDNVYPETRDDVLGGARRLVRYRAIVLENEHLRLVVLPELGGKLWSVRDKRVRREVLHVPEVIKPGLIHQSGAWIPGGMEFNFPVGHHIRGMRPVPCAIIARGPAAAAARLDFRDARSGLHMSVEIRLAGGEARFDIGYRLSNPTALPRRWYQWTNVGVSAGRGWRFLTKAVWNFTGGAVQKYPVNEYGIDVSRYRNRDVGTDSFMVGHREDFFGCYDSGRDAGVVHVAPWRAVRGKKYFTWGREFRIFDSPGAFSERGREYLEIQAGPMETQMSFALLPPGGAVSYATTWYPFRRLGALEWASRELAFAVRAGRPWLHAAVDLDAAVVIGGRRFARRLRAGRPVRLPGRVGPGTRVELHVNGRLQRAFRYPLRGRQEPGARSRVERAHLRGFDWQPRTAAGALAAARRLVLLDCDERAAGLFRRALRLRPGLGRARLELAEALGRTGDFAGGARELRKLLRTDLAGAARQALARLAAAEREFLAPVRALPAGPGRELLRAERLAGYGSFAAAARILRRLAAAGPRNWRAHYGLAQYCQHVRGDRARAVGHADRALALRPGDRDLVIELAPLYLWAARPDRAAAVIARAPRAVRDLAISQKVLARALFELDRDAECWAILSRRRLYNWEGELAHADNYVDCAAALAERALVRGELARARRFADAAAAIPPTLGVPWRRMGRALPAYWRGAVRERQGRPAEARRIWRDALAGMDRERELLRRAHGRHAGQFLGDELAWGWGMCALKLGDRAEFSRVMRGLERRRSGAAVSEFFEGVLCELHGDFRGAARCYRRHLARAAEKRLARLHLAAVLRGRRRGERPGPPGLSPARAPCAGSGR